ncbi:MAG TPA: hypothetical protein VGL34_13585 [Steroidobacteraceae bacterium]
MQILTRDEAAGTSLAIETYSRLRRDILDVVPAPSARLKAALPSKPTKHNACEQSHPLKHRKTCSFHAPPLCNPQMARLLAFQDIQSLM